MRTGYVKVQSNVPLDTKLKYVLNNSHLHYLATPKTANLPVSQAAIQIILLQSTLAPSPVVTQIS